ncbi:MAG TPA: FAD/NAD(P)-binding protein [Jatrophihabitantaceae bacterium]
MGAWGLCVLERTISRARLSDHPIRVHAIESGVLGGAAYGPGQPDYFVLNNACGQLSLYASPDSAVTPGYSLSLFEWACSRGYRWVGDECRIGEGGRPITAGDYLPRRLMGEYLSWFYETAIQELPPNLEFVRYHSAAVDIVAEGDDRERIVLADGRSIVVHHVVLTSGHTPNQEPPVRPGEVQFRPAYPIEELTESPAAGEPVAVSGMGLVAYDVIAALTTGRGGVFRDADDRKIYEPSGREPLINLYSRSGMPYCAKSVTGVDPTGDYRPVVCTPDAFAAIRGDESSPRRKVDLRRELLPLLLAEMRARYYVQAAGVSNGPVYAQRTRDRLVRAWQDGTFDEATDDLAIRHGAFDPKEHLFPGENGLYASSTDYQKHFYTMVEDDLDEALLPWGSPVKAAQEVLRILRDDIRSIIEFGGLSLESYVDFKHNVKGRVNRLEAGPPLLRSQQLLALMDAGVLQVPFGPDPELRMDANGQVVISSTQLDIPYTATVSSVIRGHLDMPLLANSASPLLSRLYGQGRLTELRYGTTAVGSVALSEDFHPCDVDGRVQRNISVLGVLTEGARYFTHYLPSPRSRIRAVLDAQACIEAIIAAW